MNCMYKKVSGWEGVGWVGGSRVGGQPEVGYNFQQDCLEVLCVQEVLVIGPDEAKGPKSHLTNTGVFIKPIPPI